MNYPRARHANPLLFSLLILCIIGSSCSEPLNSAITKRKHRKGYHISLMHKHKAPKGKENEIAQVRRSAFDALQSMPATSASTRVIPRLNKATGKALTLRTPEVRAAINAPMGTVAGPKSTVITHKPTLVLAEYSDNDSEDDARSILWLIIVIILILWLIGFLAGGLGLGGLVHLLLLVALVLFILWMLKII